MSLLYGVLSVLIKYEIWSPLYSSQIGPNILSCILFLSDLVYPFLQQERNFHTELHGLMELAVIGQVVLFR
jgi:hypothetical protein